jgi:hypothetical protein
MFTAASTDLERLPALFQVALQILGNERQLPTQLSAHLKSVVSQAVRIVADPSAISKDTLPEAIQLALDLKRSAELQEAISPSVDGSITPQTARDILAVERRFAPTR